VQSVAEDGSPRDFYATRAVVVGPDLEPRDVALSQVAPGVYEQPLGEVDPGAYAIRVSQTKPGSSALGRTLGLVAPTAAEYRLLGANQAFLATLRAATNGRAIDSPLEPWAHDLATTSSYTQLWPLLLILALLLWPFDIALRRVSVGRRELRDARRWVGDVVLRRRVAERPRPVEGMLAARDRAAGASARAAILRGDVAAAREVAAPDAASPGRVSPEPRPVAASSPPEPQPAAAPSAGVEPVAPEAAPGAAPDTLTRLREAKRRARS
jgi:hypothetical protein